MKKLAALFVLLPLPLLAAVPAHFRANRDISGSPVDSPRLVEIRLDGDIMANTLPDFPDLRLFDSANREIPRSVEPLYTTRERIARYSVATRTVDLRELAGNRIEARFDLESDAPSPSALEIRTPLRDFIRTVRVSGSEDGRFWQPLTEAEIFDYSRYMDLRRTTISLPANSFRCFSIEISHASEERIQPLVRLVQADGQDKSRAFDIIQTPFRIAGVSFWQEIISATNDAPVLREWPHAGLKILENGAARTTDITLDVRCAPLTRIEFETPVRNFNRIATVQIPAVVNGKKTWRTIADGIITRIDLPGFATNKLFIHFPEQRVDQLRVVIQNTDSPPIEITNIRPFGPVYRVLWLAEPNAQYQLAFGSDQLGPPSYDLFAIRTALEKGITPELWQLAPSPETAPADRPFRLGDFLARPSIFGSLLALAALALLALLAKALKKAA